NTRWSTPSARPARTPDERRRVRRLRAGRNDGRTSTAASNGPAPFTSPCDHGPTELPTRRERLQEPRRIVIGRPDLDDFETGALYRHDSTDEIVEFVGTATMPELHGEDVG